MIEFLNNQFVTLPRGYALAMSQDDQRVIDALDAAGIGYDTVARQRVKQLVREVRENENRECESLARLNESMKTVDAIRKRRENPNG